VVRSEEAIAAYRKLGQLAPVARITARLQRPLSTLGRLSESIEQLEAVRAELPEGSDADLGRADVDVALAYARRDAGDGPDASLRLAEEAWPSRSMDEPAPSDADARRHCGSSAVIGRRRSGGGSTRQARFQEEISGLMGRRPRRTTEGGVERFWAAAGWRGGMRPSRS
jgi:hypothetical protein